MKIKLISVFMLFVLIISVGGITYNAETVSNQDSIIYDSSVLEQISSLTEIPEKRERFTNHFLKPDGSYLAVMYTEPVNYYSNGIWEEIDNSLDDAFDSNNIPVLRNKSNDYIVEFAEATQSGKLVNIKVGDYELSWSISSGINNIAAKTAETVNSTKASSRIRYESAFQNVDIEYTTSATKVRENIILKNPSTVTEFQFDISCKNLTAKLEDDNSISFIDPEKPGEVVFTMDAPYMYDSSESADISYDIEVLFTKTESGYSLVYRPDCNWLDSPERIYPVVIDPTTSVYSTRSSSAIADTYIHAGDAPGNHTLLTYLRVGNSPDGLTRTFVKTDLPTITSGTVYSAKLLLSNTSGSSTFQNVDVYRMNSSWTSSGISWSSHLSLSKTLIASNIPASAYSNSPSAHRYVCDVTDSVQAFYSGAITNYGFMVRYTNETIADYNAFYSSDCGTTNVMPCLYISYVYNETTGIYNNGIYFIKNRNSGKYLDVSGAGIDNGTNVIQYNFHGLANRKWKVAYYGNGLYRFEVMHTTGKYLEVASYSNTNSINVDISNASLSRQLWSIQSNGNGSFRILSECSNLSKGLTVEGASTQSGANVFQYAYTGSGSDDNDDWIFEPATGSFADYFFTARDFTLQSSNAPIDTINNIQSDFSSMDYLTSYYDNATADLVYGYLPIDKIVTLHGHGSAGQIALNTPTAVEWLHGSFTPTGNDRSMINYSYNELSKICLIAFLSCHSATVPDDGESLVNMAYEKGANCALGFTVSVVGAEFWYEYFVDYLRQGHTINESLIYADNEFSESHPNANPETSPGIIGNRVVKGSVDSIIAINR